MLMFSILKTAHPLLALLLIGAYVWSGVGAFRQDESSATVFMRSVAGVSRLLLMLIYMSGLLLSMNFHLPVHPGHHYASLLPVLVIFIFQFLPALMQRPTLARWLFPVMAGTILLISLSAFL